MRWQTKPAVYRFSFGRVVSKSLLAHMSMTGKVMLKVYN